MFLESAPVSKCDPAIPIDSLRASAQAIFSLLGHDDVTSSIFDSFIRRLVW